ncbi:GNAT family N-acetyltransferase [Sporosarcina sp. ITBMC105]
MTYRSEQFVLFDGTFMPIVIRNYTEADFDEMIALQAACFPPPFPEELWWNRQQLTEHVQRFPEGAICIESNGTLIGSITSLRVSMNDDDLSHRWEVVTDNGYIRTHDPNGNALYIVDICIHPAFRKAGLGKWLMNAMYHLVIKLDVQRVLGGGRMPGYGAVANEMTAPQYIEKVVAGTLRDPVVSFLLSTGRMPIMLIEDYLEDEASKNYALLMEWKNPFHT